MWSLPPPPCSLSSPLVPPMLSSPLPPWSAAPAVGAVQAWALSSAPWDASTGAAPTAIAASAAAISKMSLRMGGPFLGVLGCNAPPRRNSRGHEVAQAPAVALAGAQVRDRPAGLREEHAERRAGRPD